MRAALLSLLLLLAAPATAATRDFPARDFDQVELKSAASVTITQGPQFAVHAEGDPALLRRLAADVDRRRLVLGWMPGGEVRGANDLRIAITMPRVSGTGISGAGSITVDRVDGSGFAASVGGAGTIRVRQLRAVDTALNMSGTGQIIVSGDTRKLAATVSGVGAIDAANLPAAAGSFTMSGTGRIAARVNGPAAVMLSGTGSVVVSGNVQCAVQKSGLGSVRCGS